MAVGWETTPISQHVSSPHTGPRRQESKARRRSSGAHVGRLDSRRQKSHNTGCASRSGTRRRVDSRAVELVEWIERRYRLTHGWAHQCVHDSKVADDHWGHPGHRCDSSAIQGARSCPRCAGRCPHRRPDGHPCNREPALAERSQCPKGHQLTPAPRRRQGAVIWHSLGNVLGRPSCGLGW